METIGGRYEILRKLGAGTTSTVYLCYDPFAEREVAVKRIHPEILKDRKRGKQFRHLLMNEASLAGRLVHPHSVQIFDAVIGEEESFIVMEYVAGGTLEPFCAPESLLPIDRVVEIAFKCTHALEYANRLGITHRDIKPANILLVRPAGPQGNADGEIKISDFGACLQNGGEQTQTQVADVVALSDTRFIVINGQSLRRASDTCRMHFYQGFLLVLSKRLARTNVLLAHA